MQEIQNNFDNAIDLIDGFILQMGAHLTHPSVLKQITDLLQKTSRNNLNEAFEAILNLNEAFELLCFAANNQEEIAQSVGNTPLLDNTDVSAILLLLDKIVYLIYRLVRNSDVEFKNEWLRFAQKISSEKSFDFVLPDSLNLFGEINGMLLFPTDEIVHEIPKDASIVSFGIENTTNLITSIRGMIDDKFVSDRYSGLTISKGLTQELVLRFNSDLEFTSTPHKPIASKGENIYQYLGENEGKKCYRKLIDFPEHDFCRHYDHLGLNIFTTNFENKRLMFLKHKSSKILKKIANSETIGRIKNNFNIGKNLGGAVFDSLYEDSLTNEQINRLLGYSLEFEANKSAALNDPTYFNRIKNFRMLDNI